MRTEPAPAGRGRGQFDRAVSFRQYIAIGFGVMIGVGWVVYAGEWLQQGGALGALVEAILPRVVTSPLYEVGTVLGKERRCD